MNKTSITLIALAIAIIGCAKFQNEVASNGGLFGSYKGDYIVRNDSGGKIMDVWVLHDVIVQSVESGSGWLFRDQNGNPVHLGGDVKVIRISNSGDVRLSDWHEYHAEFSTKSYQELYAK